MIKLRPVLWLLLFAIGSPNLAGATPLFEDTFDAEPGSGAGASGQSGLNYASFAQWTVSDGTVDLIAQGDFASAADQIACFGGSGKCVDLDGATSNAGVLTSIAILLEPGVYELSFLLSGTASSFTQANARLPNTVAVTVGSLFAGSYTLSQGDPFQAFGGSFTVSEPTSVQIAFANAGGDNFGAVLDQVTLVAVPEPALALLLGLGLAALGARQRR